MINKHRHMLAKIHRTTRLIAPSVFQTQTLHEASIMHASIERSLLSRISKTALKSNNKSVPTYATYTATRLRLSTMHTSASSIKTVSRKKSCTSAASKINITTNTLSSRMLLLIE